MAKPSASTVTINDGDILLYKRAAKDLFTKYQFKQKHDVPVITRRFADVARYVIADMRTALNGGGGKKVLEDYITALER